MKDSSQQDIEAAEVLYKESRFKEAKDYCGYAVEKAIKYSICIHNDWESFKYKWLKMHDLTLLLDFSGKRKHIETSLKKSWRVVQNWNPENRYQLDKVRKKSARSMITSSIKIINFLYENN